MTRVKGGTVTHLRHKRVLKYNKGNFGTRSRLFRRANETMLKSMWYSFRDRRCRKRDLRKLWIARINAGARINGISYSKLIYGLKKADIRLTARCWPTWLHAIPRLSPPWWKKPKLRYKSLQDLIRKIIDKRQFNELPFCLQLGEEVCYG
jgi:large subunit ribosomal protein L20